MAKIEKTQHVEDNGEAKGVIVGLKPISIGTLNVRINGLSPLIVHGWGKKALKQMLDLQQMSKEEKKKAKENRTAKDPKRDFEEAKYVINGKDSFPTVSIKKAMCDAGYALGISKSVIRQAIFIVGDYFEIKHKRCVMREDTVRVGPFGNRSADLRYRPEYRDWGADLEFKFRTDMIAPDQLVALLQSAGFSVGIGEWRPQKDGQFGTFEVQTKGKKKK